ncbi:Molybdopterin molybdenumtransferase [Tsuneonella dongtanensis]|uniref:Molybdopterin molybdenumtransferase n=1 Tax=Tsuneonella dongtanensis TaxID=692370 RepID=A0A1B2A931_9SPHN|nr:molybdopterin molybdotransferase MoeA [Tsuneonella dongtanensis]ANY18621.1 Molybdopterin molybdenumtransferase [Tsuneonella dongtanensis]
MISFDEARARLFTMAHPLGKEPVALAKAAGRVLAEAVVARVDSPPRDVSTMDGYAVRSADLEEPPVRLRIVSEVFAGADDPGSIASGECARIFTGAPIPAHADRVVVQEVVEKDGDCAVFADAPSPGRNIRVRAGDFAAGTALLTEGTLLGPRQMVAAAAADLAEVTCWRRPRVRLLATGDELADPGSARGRPGAIPESISFGVDALVVRHGGEFCGTLRLGDDLAAMERAAGEALRQSDLVVVSGGASVGERDFAKAAFDPHGLDLLFAKVAIKPGKPVWLGKAAGKLVLGLPGNPTSALVTARLFLAPLVAGLAGRPAAPGDAWTTMVLGSPLGANGDREAFIRARRSDDGRVYPLDNQDSGAQHALAYADVLLRSPAHAQALPAGASVPGIEF